MIRPIRLGAAASIAALGVSLATPALDSASAAASPHSLPAPTQLTTALNSLGLSSSTVSALVSEITALQTGGVTTTNLGSLDETLGPLLSSVNSLLGELGLEPVAEILESTIGDLSGLLPSGATAAQTQALTELTTALTSAGLGTLLSGLTSDNGAAAITQLSALQNLVPGASTAPGGLSSIGAIVTQLASRAPAGPAATTLTSIASLLDSSSALTPAQLETAITELMSVTSGAGSGTSGVDITQAVQALASQLAQSGSLLGGLADVGSTLSALTDSSSLTTALGQLSALSTLTPSASSPLSGVAAVLTAIAATPGVSGTPAASTLNSLATTLSSANGVSPTDLLATITSLQGLSGSLPAPLNTLVSQVTTQLTGSGSIFGNLPGLDSSDAATALAELTSLAGLSLGSETPLLPGLGAVITSIAAQAPIAGTPVAALLDQLASAIANNQLAGSALAAVAAVLNNVSMALPAPLNTTVSGLAGLLSSDASQSTGTTGSTGTPGSTGGTGATGSTGTGSTSATGATGTNGTNGTSSTSYLAISIPGVSPAVIAAAEKFHWGLLRKETRTGNALTVTLTCVAYKGAKCTDTMKATEKNFHALTRKVTMNAGKTDKFVLKLKPITAKKVTTAVKQKATRRAAIKFTVTSGTYKVAKTFR